jgi:Cu-Zn family superoxide dismutase
VFDADGSAIVMHMKGDDYKSQPSGAAGGRIACGVIK